MADPLPATIIDSRGRRRPKPPAGAIVDHIGPVQVLGGPSDYFPDAAVAEPRTGPHGIGSTLGDFILGHTFVGDDSGTGFKDIGPVQVPGAEELIKTRFRSVKTVEQLQEEARKATQTTEAGVTISDDTFALIVKREGESIFSGIVAMGCEEAGELYMLHISDPQFAGVELEEGDQVVFAPSTAEDVKAGMRSGEVLVSSQRKGEVHAMVRQDAPDEETDQEE